MKTGEKFEIIVTDARDTIGLAGRTASIVTENGGNKAFVVNNGSIAMTDTTVLKEDGSGLGAGESIYSLAADTSLYSNQSDTAWTFEYDDATGGYHISNQGKYLKIVGNQLQYVEAQVVDNKIIKPTVYVSKNRKIDQESARTDSAGNTLYSYTWTDWDGTYLLSDAPAYTVDKDTQKLTPNSDATYLASNGTISADRNNAAMLVLCMPEDPTKDVRKASLVHAGDLSDGEDIIIYKKIWNNSRNNYDYYAIDINGEPVRIYDSSDSVYWKKQGDEFPKIEWTLEEGTNEDGSPSGYLYLTQTNESGETVYLCPQYDGYVVRTLGPDEDKNAVGISLPGRNDNTEGSRISAWDYDANVTCGVYLERDPAGNGIRRS